MKHIPNDKVYQLCIRRTGWRTTSQEFNYTANLNDTQYWNLNETQPWLWWSNYCKGKNTAQSHDRLISSQCCWKAPSEAAPASPSSLIPILPGISLLWQHSCTVGSHQSLWSTPSFPHHFHNCWGFYFAFRFSCSSRASIGISVQFCLSFSSPSQNPMKYCSSKNINPRWELFESPVPHLCYNWELLSFIYSFFIPGHKQWESPQPITQAVFESNLPDTCISRVT